MPRTTRRDALDLVVWQARERDLPHPIMPVWRMWCLDLGKRQLFWCEGCGSLVGIVVPVEDSIDEPLRVGAEIIVHTSDRAVAIEKPDSQMSLARLFADQLNCPGRWQEQQDSPEVTPRPLAEFRGVPFECSSRCEDGTHRLHQVPRFHRPYGHGRPRSGTHWCRTSSYSKSPRWRTQDKESVRSATVGHEAA
jgi:hypothetical protein